MREDRNGEAPMFGFFFSDLFGDSGTGRVGGDVLTRRAVTDRGSASAESGGFSASGKVASARPLPFSSDMTDSGRDGSRR